MKVSDLIEAKKAMPKMVIPGAKITMPHTWKSKMIDAVKKMGFEIQGSGYTDGSTSWSVAIPIKKNFDIEKFQKELRDKLQYDHYLTVEFFDLVEK